MAISQNLLTAGLKGALNKQVVFRQRNGKTIVSAYPDMSKRKLSKKQLEVNKRMTEANIYAQTVLADADESAKAQVRLDIPRNKLYTSLIREFFKQNSEAG